MNIQRCVFFTSIAAPDQRPIIRCQRMHRESRPWDFLAGRFRSGENPGGGVWRTREDCNISVPLCHIADADSFAGTGSICTG